MQVDSLQPKIVDNAKGLYVSFSIVGVLLGLVQQPAALSVTIGDIPPASTAEIRFLLTSTLAVRIILCSTQRSLHFADCAFTSVRPVMSLVLADCVSVGQLGCSPTFVRNPESDPGHAFELVSTSAGPLAKAQAVRPVTRRCL